jgi:glutamate-1-semialdehyde 2,1-aminomutase
MEWTSSRLVVALLASTALVLLLPKLSRRVVLSRAKHRSLTGHVRMAKRVAGWMPAYSFDERRFFASG